MTAARAAAAVLYLAAGGLIAWQVVGFFAAAAAAVGLPYGLDYGEGIVWQQALLIPGPAMYGDITGFPWIVFHYPPLYHLAVRAMALVVPDMLAAGRLVSLLATIAVGACAGALAFRIARGWMVPGWCWLAAGLACALVFTLPPVRFWGFLMRVDMLAVALGLAGVLCAGLALRRPALMALAMLAFVAAVYTKQTAIAAPAATLLVLACVRPRLALAGLGLGLLFGGVPLLLLHLATEGGFLRHLVLYNINRYSLAEATRLLGILVPLWMTVPLLGVVGLGWGWRRWRAGGERLGRSEPGFLLAVLAVYGLLLTFMLPGIGKSGASSNYLIEWLCAFTPAAGLLLAMAVRSLARDARPALPLFLLPVLLLMLPRDLGRATPVADPAALDALGAEVRAADRPVLSDDMVLLLRAGRGVAIEPAIFAELTALGAWDEAPLLAMIRRGGFALAIIHGPLDGRLARDRYSDAVRAAIREALPRSEAVGGVTVHRPAVGR